jgi:hypothetical protein
MVPSERARAVVEVEPNHAACYWQVISETLTQLGAQGSHLEISVVDKAKAHGAGAQLVLLELSSPDLDQATLDAAIRRAHPACTPRARVVESGDPVDPEPLPAEVEWHTVVAPLSRGPSVTISAPLGSRHDQTVHAPLVPTPISSSCGPAGDLEQPSPTALPMSHAPPRNLRVLAFGLLLTLIALTIVVVGLHAVTQG